MPINKVVFENNAGNVGIGTTTPGYKLHVNGQIGASSLIDIDQTNFFVNPAETTVLNILQVSQLQGAGGGNFGTSASKKYVSLSGPSGGWYRIFSLGDSDLHGTVIVNLRTYAHNSVTFTVARGYGPGQHHSINILQAIANANGNYANVTGIRIRENGDVEIRLTWSNGPTVNIGLEIVGSDATPTPAATLEETTSTSVIVDSVTNLVSGMMRSRTNMYVGSEVVWNAGNDGPGSGLNADLLDGYDSTRFLRSEGNPAYGDWNTYGNTGQVIYQIFQEHFNSGTNTGSSNYPGNASYLYGTLLNFSSTDSARAQIYISHAGNDLIFRGGWGTGGWQTWNKVWTDINDGSGSGLDADLLDGRQGSGYVNTDNNSSLNTDSRNTRGVTRLYRWDDNSDYSVQTYWTGSRWRLYGYNGDTAHADTHVGYADLAGSVVVGNVNFDDLGAKGGGTGDYITSGSFRAPIFYDSNNTNYYLDPAGYSQLNRATFLNRISVGNGVTPFINTGTAGIWISTDGAASHFFGTHDSNSSWLGIYTNSGWKAYLDADGNWFTTGSVRSPIFYDYNNTGYYLDSTSTTSLRTVGSWRADSSTWDGEFAGKIQYHNNSWYFQASNVWIWRNAGGSDVIYGDQSGNHFATGSSRAPYFYDQPDTSYFANPAGESSFSSLRLWGNYMVIRGSSPTIYFRDTDHLSAMLHNNSNLFYILRGDVDSQTWTTVNGYWPQYWNLSNNYILMGGITETVTDFRAPTFRDSNDTNYYLDPAGYSQLNRATFLNRISVGNGVIPFTNTGTAGIWISNSGAASHFIGSHDANLSWLGIYTNSAWAAYLDADGNWFTTGSVRSPWFYDRDNTNYYLNPASTTSLRTVGSWRADSSTWDGEFSGKIQYHANHWYFQSADLWIWRNAAGTNVIYGDQSGNHYATGSSRAPIFYDRDDTSYYTNPAGLSILNQLGISKSAHAAGASNYHLELYSPNSGSASNEVSLRFHQADQYWGQIRYRSVGFRFTNGSDDTLVPIFASTFNVGSSINAPIYYDSNNTNYYLDPNSTTSLRTVGSWRADSSTWDGEFSGKIQYHNNSWYFQASNAWIWRNAGGTNVIYGDQSGNHFATGSSRAPIFYDQDDTGYYTSPNTNTRLNAVYSNYYASAFAGADSGITRSSLAYSFGFQEAGAWTSPFPDMVFQYHTGMKFAAYAGYEGMRFYQDYNDDTLVFQVNGSSNYLYKYNWLYTNTSGMYSDTNGAHINPNTSSSYGSWRVLGNRGGYGGIYDGYSGVATMFDSGGNGGFYREANSRWFLYHNVGNNSLGINSSTTSASYALYVTGAIYATNDIVAFSDSRKKENIIQIDNALEKVNQLRGVYYNKIDDNSKKRLVGVIAQELNKVIPEAVTYADDVDEYGVSYGNLAGLFIEAFKEQTKLINKLKEEVEFLKNKLEIH